MEETQVVNVENKKKKSTGKIIGNVFFWFFIAIFAFIGVTFLVGYSTKADNYGVSNFYGYQMLNVLTDSMEPKYPVDSIIITKKVSAESMYKSYQANKDKEGYYLDISFVMKASGIDEDNIEFTPIYEGGWTDILASDNYGNTVMTHRVVAAYAPTDTMKDGNEFGEYVFITQGINIGGHDSAKDQYQIVRAKYVLGKVQTRSVVIGAVMNFILSVPGLLCLLILPCGYIIVTTILDTRKKWIEEEKAEEAAIKANAIEVGTKKEGSSTLDSLSEEERERLKKEMLDEMLGKGKK